MLSLVLSLSLLFSLQLLTSLALHFSYPLFPASPSTSRPISLAPPLAIHIYMYVYILLDPHRPQLFLDLSISLARSLPLSLPLYLSHKNLLPICPLLYPFLSPPTFHSLSAYPQIRSIQLQQTLLPNVNLHCLRGPHVSSRQEIQPRRRSHTPSVPTALPCPFTGASGCSYPP